MLKKVLRIGITQLELGVMPKYYNYCDYHMCLGQLIIISPLE